MSNPNIILIGGGGHCKSCIDVLELEDKFTIAGIIDVKEKIGNTILGYPIIGSDDDLPQIAEKYDYFLITLGQIKSPNQRVELFEKIKKLGKKLPLIVSPKSYISPHSQIGEGTIIMHNVIINAASTIGNNCIVNTASLIEHDTDINDHCHISTNAIINGNCTIKEGTFIGSNATINQSISIAKNCIIGSGSLVLKNIITQNSTWVGNPTIIK